MEKKSSENFELNVGVDCSGKTFEYTLLDKKTNEVVITGDGFDSIEQAYEELSYLNEALRSIFG